MIGQYLSNTNEKSYFVKYFGTKQGLRQSYIIYSQKNLLSVHDQKECFKSINPFNILFLVYIHISIWEPKNVSNKH